MPKPAKAQIQVEGLREFRSNLNAVDRNLAKGLTAIHKEIAGPVADAARSRVRSRTGRLADSIRPGGTQRAATITAGRKAVPYAPINHYGGYPGDYGGNPFLEDTIAALEPRIIHDYEDAFARFLETVWVDS